MFRNLQKAKYGKFVGISVCYGIFGRFILGKLQTVQSVKWLFTFIPTLKICIIIYQAVAFSQARIVKRDCGQNRDKRIFVFVAF